MSIKQKISVSLYCLTGICIALIVAVVIYELYGKYVCTTTWVAAGYPCLCEHFGTLFWAKVAVLSGMGTVFMGIDTLMNSQKAQSQLKSQHN